MKNFVYLSDLIIRLKRYKSYIHKYTTHSMNYDWKDHNPRVYTAYPNAVLGYQALQFVDSIPIYDKNRTTGKRERHPIDEIDRLIISNRLGLIIDTSRCACVVGFEANPIKPDSTVPFIPLNKYIRFIEEGFENGYFKRSQCIYLDNNLDLTSTDRVLTTVSDALLCPIIWKKSTKADSYLLTEDEAYKNLQEICTFLDENGWKPKERRKKDGRPNSKNHKFSAG